MKFAAVDVRQAASAADLVYEALRKAIIEGKIAEGDSLRQEEIAQMFNTSRIPVREVEKRLEAWRRRQSESIAEKPADGKP